MKKTKVLMICHGNICRSPMAQFILQSKVDARGLTENFEIDSAATSTEEIGNSIYPDAYKVLISHGVKGVSHRARQITKQDYSHFDQIYVMDRNNLRNIAKVIGTDVDNKVSLLLGSCEIEDPWYTGNFELVFKQIDYGCEQILKSLNIK